MSLPATSRDPRKVLRPFLLGAALLALAADPGVWRSAAVRGQAPAGKGPAGQVSKPAPAAARPQWWRERLTLDRPVPDGSAVAAMAFTHDGTAVLVADRAGTVGVFDALSGKGLKELLPSDKLLALRALPDGKALVFVGHKAVRWVDAATRTLLREVPWHPVARHRVALSPDGALAAVAGSEGQVELWRLGARAESVPLPRQPEALLAVALSPDGKQLATGGAKGTVKVWDVGTRREVLAFRVPGGGPVRALAFTPDGQTLALAHGSRGVEVRELSAGKGRPALKGHPLTFLSLAASPDGRVLAAGTANGAVRLWDLATGDVLQTFKAHAGQVQLLVFAADGKAFASASNDETVKLWRPVGPVAEAPPEPPVAARDMQELLTTLRSPDPARALKAVLTLASTPRQTLAQLGKLLHPVPAIAPERFARLLADLDSRRFAVREKARRELEECGDQARDALKKALASRLSLEVRQRVLGLLDRLDRQDTPEVAFQRRAVEVLEKIAAREARELLQTLTTGVAEARLTRYAQDALRRLDE